MTNAQPSAGCASNHDGQGKQGHGLELSYSYSLEKSAPDALRLGYLDVTCSSGLATVGLGYSFKKATALGYVGAVGSHAKVVGELDGKTQLGAGLEVHSIPCAGDRETH